MYRQGAMRVPKKLRVENFEIFFTASPRHSLNKFDSALGLIAAVRVESLRATKG